MSWRQYLYAETQRPPLSFWDKLTQSFFPPKEDPELQAEFAGLAESAFRVAGLVLVGAVAWVLLLEQVIGIPTAGRPWGHVAMALTGVLAYAMSYSETARQHARPVAVALGLLLASICIVSVLYYLPVHPEEDHHLPGTLCLVMLAIVAIFPLRPTHTLVLTGATTMLHFALATVGPTLLGITAKPGAGHAMTTGLGALVALGVSSLMYAQRRRAFRANQVTQQALSSLQETYQGRKTGFERPTCENSSKRTAASEGSTYTHKPLTPTNRALVREANENGFTVNLSANNLG